MMALLSSWWFTFLYQPVFNALIWIYSHVADHNLGWAVVWLTIFLRILLLPLNIISQYNSQRRVKAVAEAEKILVAFKEDRVAQKEEARRIMRKFRISPWAKVAMLFIQGLVLILLYQVFIRGISGDKVIKILYSFIDFPGQINTVFYGFEIGRRHDWLWAGAAALYLFFSIYIINRKQLQWKKSEVVYLFVFPLFTFTALWILPMVKSLFILTTMIFSDTLAIVVFIFSRLFGGKKKETAVAHR